jgi:ParB-like chromosome segregation protein Spo0J
MAAIRAKLKSVPVRVVDSDEAGLALIELDENAVRRHLTPTAEAKLVGKRDALMLKSGVASKALRDKALAAELGVSDRKARRSRTRAKALDSGLLEKLAKTSLRFGVELDALIALDDATRFDLIERAIAGEDVSAKKVRAEMEAREDALLKAKAPTGLGSFCAEWRKLDKPTALRALEWLRAEVGTTYVADQTDSYDDFAPAFEVIDIKAAIEMNNAQ